MKYTTWLSFPLITFACLIPLTTKAQITPDNSLGNESSVVNPLDSQGLPVDLIDGGATRGANLFHSFQDFNVEADRGAYFNNPNGINNIFSRVTGANVSNINGLLGVLGDANLFLINPNGIIFGQNARLDLGGSFFASTADSLLFEGNTEFSASNPQASPLLEVSIPIGARFRENPGAIVNRSAVDSTDTVFIGLRLQPGNDLTFVGGDIEFDSGFVTVPGGKVELGGLSEAGIVEINEDGGLSFPDDVARADASFNYAQVDVRSGGGGSITINARNIELSDTTYLLAGIGSALGLPEAQAGNINLNATEAITAIDSSLIENNVNPNATGNSGNVNITTKNLSLANSTRISSSTEGQGNAGSVLINATENVSFDGGSGAFSQVLSEEAIGNGGNINITTKNLSLTNTGVILSAAFGVGDAGNILVNATETISLDSESLISSGIFLGGRGDAGNIEITTTNLEINNGSRLTSDNFEGQGNGGNVIINASETVFLDGGEIESGVGGDATGNGGRIEITTKKLSLTNNAEINGNTFGLGDAGDIFISASELVEVKESDIANGVAREAQGTGGNLDINTDSLIISDGAGVFTDTAGERDAGNVNILASESVQVIGADSFLSADVRQEARGQGGDLIIETGSLSISDGAQVSTSTLGFGNAGNLIVRASNSVALSGRNSINPDLPSGLTAQVNPEGQGDAGNLTIDTGQLIVLDGAQIATAARNQGQGGTLTINASDSILLSGGVILPGDIGRSGLFVSAQQGATNNAGELIINTRKLTVEKGARISADTFGIGNGGDATLNINQLIVRDGGQIRAGSLLGEDPPNNERGSGGTLTINASESVEVFGTGTIDSISENSTLFTQGQGTGNAGKLNIFTNNLSVQDGAEINVSATGSGEAGDLLVETNSIDLNNGLITAATIAGEGGNIIFQVDDALFMRDNSLISAQAFDKADGGNLTIDTDFIIAFPNGNNDIIASAAQGNGGNINITAESLFGIEERPLNPFTNDINASSEFGFQGNISINTPDVDPTSGLINLPASVSNASDQISQNPCEQGVGSEFIVTGKGGLPPNVNEAINSEEIQVDLVAAVPSQQKKVEANGTSIDNPPISEAVPAQGWVFNEQGEVTLTAYNPTNTGVQRSQPTLINSCSASLRETSNFKE